MQNLIKKYNNWCIKNDLCGDILDTIEKFAHEFNLTDDEYNELISVIEPLDLDATISESKNRALVKEFVQMQESFGEDKQAIIKFMKMHGIDIEDDNEFISDFIMAFGHGPYNVKFNSNDNIFAFNEF